MSDEPTPELRALAAKLFAAARAEGPGPALGRRLSLIEPGSAQLPALVRRESSAPARRTRLARPALPLWLAAAALLAAGAGLWLSNDREALIRISPERESRGASTRREERAPVAAAERETALEEPAATPPRPDDAQRPTAAARVRPAQRHAPAELVDSTPQNVTAPPAATPPAARALSSSAELELLKRARSALRSGAGARALELLDQHARERAGNELEAEATLLRIETLSTLGRREEASQLATRFVRSHPNHALGDRARSFIRQPQSGTP